MDLTVPRRRGRPRKRPLADAEALGPDPKKRVVVNTRSTALVGQYVLKEFDSVVYLGRIVFYDSGLYRIEYEDGDCEDLDSGEIRKILVDEDVLSDELRRNRKALDKLIADKSSKKETVNDDKVAGLVVLEAEPSRVSCEEDRKERVDGGSDVDDDNADSSSDSCGNELEVNLDETLTLPPAPELPPSSGSISIPEEYVSHLLSVYGVLRSFSIQLFLCPFGLDDFVGALNRPVQNSLIDAIHVALLCTLRRHLESLPSDGPQFALKCLRYVDWSLLDSMTWPVYLSHYLTLMGYIKREGWEGFDSEVLDKNYYRLSAGRKLLILQILCDDVLDCSEVRTEINMREEVEVGIDSDSISEDGLENGSRTAPLQNSKSLAFKNRDAMRAMAEGLEMRSQPVSDCGTGNPEAARGVAEYGADGNSDECRLCGMDGTLLCCDGCPSAYHARCIGVTKIHIPEGSWFCPECTIDKAGLSVTHGTSLVGAEIFGIDPYQQVFLGTCNHLLVLKVSAGDQLCFRYYNHKDVVNVLQALNYSAHQTTFYVEICKAIVRYWEVPEYLFSLSEIIENQGKQASAIDAGNYNHNGTVFPIEEKERHCCVGLENSSISGDVSGAQAFSCVQPFEKEMTHPESVSCNLTGGSDMLKDGFLNVRVLEQMKVEQMKVESVSSASSVTQQGDPSDIAQLSSFERVSSFSYPPCTSRNTSSSCNGNPTGMHLPSTRLWKKEQGFPMKVSEGTVTDNLYTGLMFKCHAYINCYLHGYFAATAAANLAMLSAEEGHIIEPLISGSCKKVLSASSQYMRAFSAAASRFFWPSSDKKMWEVPRERCGWCHTCKAPISSRRGCMLNSAALAATKSTVKILNGLLPLKNGEGTLSSIATHMLVIEESFRGLVSGPFLEEKFRKDWRELVEKATSCTALGLLLLKLEEHIRPIALSGDWTKLVDDYLSEFSVSQEATGTSETTQKRGPGRRKKQFSVPEVTSDDRLDKTFIWWRGGTLSKLFPNNAFLPRAMVRRAACQAGLRKISALHHSNGFDIPKRSRQIIWRAAVETSNSTPRLALQVRYLDRYLRWNDLVRPEQSSQDGKGADAEASAFRNAVVCDKKIVEDKVLYGVDFGMQKHLPSRVMKTIINIEQSVSGKDKHWFADGHIPLYLIKEYEESVHVPFPSSHTLSTLSLKFQRTQLKAARMDVFSYLVCRRDNVDRIACLSCHRDVLLRKAIKCCSCQGFCHEGCFIGSTASGSGFCCLQCSHAKAFSRNESTESPTSPLLLQTRDCRSSSLIIRFPKVDTYNPLVSSVKPSNKETKRASSGSSLPSKTRTRMTTRGIIWKKKSTNNSGSDFRMRNILLRGDVDLHWSGPVCHLCKKPYNSDLMYIRCPTCTYWYHADAVELTESKVFDVLGFKCCKCRRIKSPECPYDDRTKKGDSQKQQSIGAKQEQSRLESDTENVSNSTDYEATTPLFLTEDMFMDDEDPLLQSSSKVEQIADEINEAEPGYLMASGRQLQKLPVRRHTKRDGMVDGLVDDNSPRAGLSVPQEMSVSADLVGTSSSPALAWDISGNGVDGEILFDYEDFNCEDMEFEPQTYFSFTELLADGEADVKDDPLKWEEMSSAGMQDGVAMQEPLNASHNGVDHTTENTAFIAHCQMCSQSEPFPDLYCEVCGLNVHSHCSPWADMGPGGGNWRCGDCREWR